MLDETGARVFEDVNTYPPAETKNVYRRAAVELIFAQIWTRPGLTRRQRRWVSLTAAGLTGVPVGITAHVYGALNSGDITVEEMGEFLLHFACYAGWARTTLLDTEVSQALERISAQRGTPAPERAFAPLPDIPLAGLADTARHTREAVLGSCAGPAPHGTPAADILAGLEYGQAWSRPQLPRADRRLITITCLAAQGHLAALRAHLTAALRSGDLDESALREVALHAGLYAGVMTGRAIDAAISDVTGQDGPGDSGNMTTEPG